MQFIDAEWVHDDVMGTTVIKATGDDGQTYWIPDIDTDVPPWPDFIKEGGTVKGTPPKEEK